MIHFLRALVLATFLFSSAFAQDVSNPQCNGPWVAYTPGTVAAQTPGITPPTFILVSARYKICGNKTVMVTVNVAVTAAGTGAGSINISLPFAASSFWYIGTSFEFALTGIGGTTAIAPNATVMNLRAAAAGAAYILTGQSIAGTVVYELP
jgi:hypothetical protein